MGLKPVAPPVNPLRVLDGPDGVFVGLEPPPGVDEMIVVPLVGGGGGVPVPVLVGGQYVVVKVWVKVVEPVVTIVVPVDVVVEDVVGDVG